MALWEVDNPSEFGIVGLASSPDGEVDGKLREGFIRRFLEKPSPEEAFSNVINAGLYILEPEVFDHIPHGEKFDFSKQLFPTLLKMGWPLYAQTIDGVWFDVGQPFELIRAQSTLMERYSELPFSYPSSYLESNGVLRADDAQVDGNVTHSVIGRGCFVEAEGEVSHSLLMDTCTVESGASVQESVIGVGVVVPSGTVLKHCVVGDAAVLTPGEVYLDKKIPNEPAV